MSFIQERTFEVSKKLHNAHYGFERANILRKRMEWMITDYAAKQAVGRPFEARGLIVTGPSRIGKSQEIGKMLIAVNDGTTIMPDGRPATFENVVLSGSMSFKELGKRVLKEGLKYGQNSDQRFPSRATQGDIWDLVFFQAREQGVVGLHFDECQHIFSGKSEAVRKVILDSFKALLKRTEWPLMLILSGVDDLTEFVAEEEQLSYLLRPVEFTEIRLGNGADLKEINDICHLYASKVGVEFPETFWSRDFFQRMAFSSANRWGLLIELVRDALVNVHNSERDYVIVEDFCKAFTDRTGFPAGHSPFLLDCYEDAFDKKKILEMVQRKEVIQKRKRRKAM